MAVAQASTPARAYDTGTALKKKLQLPVPVEGEPLIPCAYPWGNYGTFTISHPACFFFGRRSTKMMT